MYLNQKIKKYVLKFFKFHHVRIPPLLKYLPLKGKLAKYRDYKIAKKERTLKRTFSSYVIAENHFKKETGLVYLHLGETNHLNTKIHLIDRLGIHHKIDADQTAFVIQKKGKLFYEVLQSCIDEGRLDEAKQAISEILILSMRRCLRGIGDEDPNFCTNFGFIDHQAAQIDMGRFFLDEAEKDPTVYKPEIFRITRDFRTWLSENYPMLVEHFDKEVLKIKGDMVF